MNTNRSKLKEMSLIDHITELRKRLLWIFVYIIIIFIICFYFAETLFAFLARPLVSLLDTDNGQGFIYTALQEAFFTELRIAFFFALFFSFPLIAIQIWKFIAPGLYTKEKRAFFPFQSIIEKQTALHVAQGRDWHNKYILKSIF